jgi:hypothetical protein
MTEQFTTRMTKRFSRQIAVLRAGIEAMDDANERSAILDRFEKLASDLAMGFPVLEQVPRDVAAAELAAERAREGDLVRLELPSDADITGLLNDTERLTSSFRDNRNHEPETAHAV